MTSYTQFSILNSSLLLLLVGIISSCGGSRTQADPKDATPIAIVFDTLQKAGIDSMVNIINEGVKEADGPQKLPFPLHNENDTLHYWEVKDDAARISIEWTLPNEIIWPTFFVYKGELIFVRYRYMYQEPPSNSRAFESMIYLENGKIIYCEERGQPLQDGEKPGLLRLKEYSKSTRTYAEIEQDYLNYWKTVKSFMKKNDVLPDYIKQ